jgi:tetratricopeptide (TPR) repeat protein
MRMIVQVWRTIPLSLWLALSLTAQTLQQLDSTGRERLAANDAGGALAAYEKLAALVPQSAVYQDEIGFLLAATNHSLQAIPHFQRATELDPQLAQAWYHLGAAMALIKGMGGLSWNIAPVLPTFGSGAMPTNPLRPMCNILRIGPKVGTQDLPLSGLQCWELYSRSEGRAKVSRASDLLVFESAPVHVIILICFMTFASLSGCCGAVRAFRY